MNLLNFQSVLSIVKFSLLLQPLTTLHLELGTHDFLCFITLFS